MAKKTKKLAKAKKIKKVSTLSYKGGKFLTNGQIG
jgi:hypothetical protein